jgi:hypothetical protein
MAEGDETRPHGKSYVETVCDDLLVYGCDGGRLEFIYEEHGFIVLPWVECRVCR